jgi:hypothetical protein
VATAAALADKPPHTRRSRVAAALARRWPTAVAVLLGVSTLFDGPASADVVSSHSEALVLLPLLYLVMAAVQRRRGTWGVFWLLITPFVVLRAVDVVPPSAVFTGLALVVLLWGAFHGHVQKPGLFRIQALGIIGFGALALAGLVVDPQLGRYLVAAGWFLHGVWDLVHLRTDTVVSRSYAEWCGVLDVLIAAELFFGW